MVAPYISNAVPKNLEWWGIGREVTPGTLVLPTVTIPLSSGAPDDKYNMLVDKALRGDMGEDYNEVLGTRLGEFGLAGNVYLDSIGNLLYNLFGDYQAQGTTTGTAALGTMASTLAAGSTGTQTVTGGAAVATPGVVKISGTGSGDVAELVTFSSSTLTTVVLTGRTKYAHSGTVTFTQVGTTTPLGLVTGALTAGTAPGATAVTNGSTVAAPGGFTMLVGANGATEVVQYSVASTTSVTIVGATRFTYAAASVQLLNVVAPFTHVFSLLNGGAQSLGLSQQGQPVTHSILHNSALAQIGGANSIPGPTQAANFQGQRLYGYWCAAGMDVTMNLNNLFQHATKGSSFLGQDVTNGTQAGPPAVPAGPATNSQTDAGAQPNWRFTVAFGGTAANGAVTSGTTVSTVEQSGLSIVRQTMPKYGLNNQQDPIEIVRMGLSSTGKMSIIAQDESPLLQYLTGNTLPIVIGMTNGGAGALLQSITFQYSRAIFEAATLTDPDTLCYEVGFRALMNSNDIGISGARSPMLVTLTNNVPTY